MTTQTRAPQSTTSAADAPPPVDKVRGFAVSSAGLLRASRLLAALACLIAGAVGAWVLTATSASLSDINTGTQQVLRLEQIRGDILRADGIATQGLVQGTSAASLTDYNAALTEAANLTVDAAQAQPLDNAELAKVNAGLITYVLTMERARATYPKDAAAGLTLVTDAGQSLVNDTDPHLTTLLDANRSRVTAAKASDRLWAAGLALVPVVLLLGLSVWLARRTKRVVNLGLAVALVASFGLWQLVDSNLAATNAVVDGARAGSLQTAIEASTAYASLAECKFTEGRELLQPSKVANMDTAWVTSMGHVNDAVKLLGDKSAATSALVSSYSTAHTALVELLKADKLADAKASAASTTTGVGPSYKTASDALSKVFTDAKVATASDMAAQREALRMGFVIAVLLGVLGAIASWIGISRRLREYR